MDHLTTARNLAQHAVRHDKDGKKKQALDGYKKALEYFMIVLRENSAAPRKEKLKELVNSYMRRAEQLSVEVKKMSNMNSARNSVSVPGSPGKNVSSSIRPSSSTMKENKNKDNMRGGISKPTTSSKLNKIKRKITPPSNSTTGSTTPSKRVSSTTTSNKKNVAVRERRARVKPALDTNNKKGKKSLKLNSNGAVEGENALEKLVLSEIVDKSLGVSWEDIAGLSLAKQTLMEAVIYPSLRPDLYTGLRAPPKGVLLFGPPASSLTSKYVGESEKMVRALFSVARKLQPSVIFVDEIDSLLSSRSSNEHEASRRLKTEFLVQLDGAVTNSEERLLIMGATNRPQELDDAVIRRLVKRIYVPLPDDNSRRSLIQHLLRDQVTDIDTKELDSITIATSGYSGSDLNALCKESAMGPIRDIGSRIHQVSFDEVRPIQVCDFIKAIEMIRPSVSVDVLSEFEEWNKQFGSTG